MSYPYKEQDEKYARLIDYAQVLSNKYFRSLDQFDENELNSAESFKAVSHLFEEIFSNQHQIEEYGVIWRPQSYIHQAHMERWNEVDSPSWARVY